MAFALVGVTSGSMVDTHIDARLALGLPASELCDRLGETHGAEAQLALLEAFLLTRIDERALAPRAVRSAVATLDGARPSSIAAIVEASALFVRASIWRAELIDYDKIPCNFHG
jgi:hypothetical protein